MIEVVFYFVVGYMTAMEQPGGIVDEIHVGPFKDLITCERVLQEYKEYDLVILRGCQ